MSVHRRTCGWSAAVMVWPCKMNDVSDERPAADHHHCIAERRRTAFGVGVMEPTMTNMAPIHFIVLYRQFFLGVHYLRGMAATKALSKNDQLSGANS